MIPERFISLPPFPLTLIESLRDIGYSMETAIADIVDNSLAADAHTIWIRFAWNAGNPWLAVVDDGHGMSGDELVAAMRFGSTSPRARRKAEDLGRFGLGMKTASFSQCRRLTVLSKRDNGRSACEWDLGKIADDESGDWPLRILDGTSIQRRATLSHLDQEYLSDTDGTVVLWEDLDRIESSGSSRQQEKLFDSSMADTRKHLELVFHRFLAPPRGARKRTRILMNETDVVAFDPFNTKSLATQELPEQRFALEGQEVRVQPYVLPHYNKVSRQDYEAFAGDGGYLHNQGFYVYRNERLIMSGTWFRLIKKEELNKLIRVRVDIPNTLDHLWKLDIRKASASPPESVRTELLQVIGRIEEIGRTVYRARGSRLSSSVQTPAWQRRAGGGRITYEINRNHPLFLKLLEGVSAQQSELLKNFATTLESSFPVEVFYNDVAGSPEQLTRPEFDEAGLTEVLEMFLQFWSSPGADGEVADRLLSIEPFASHRDLTLKILRDRGSTS